LVRAVAFAPDSYALVSGSNDSSVRIWDVVKWDESLIVGNRNGATSAVAFSPDSKLLALGETNGTIRIWDLSIIEKSRNLKSLLP